MGIMKMITEYALTAIRKKNSSRVWTDTRLFSVHIHRAHGIYIQRSVIGLVRKTLDRK